MEIRYIAGSLYGIGFSDNKEKVVLDESIMSDVVTVDLIRAVCQHKYKMIFLKEGNIFSHEMNILRKALFNNKHVKMLLGAGELFSTISEADECIVDMSSNSIIIGDVCYQFGGFDYFKDSSEIIEYDIDTASICYKPDFYYHQELAELIRAGFSLTGSQILKKQEFSVSVDRQNRVWCSGEYWPSKIAEICINEMENYFQYILEYLNVLEELLIIIQKNEKNDKLCELLKEHYKYSLLFSFSIPYLSRYLIEHEGINQLEKVYGFFSSVTPLQDKYRLTSKAIYDMKKILGNIYIKNVSASTIVHMVYNLNDEIDYSIIDVCYLLTNMISDLRRCVINIVIEKNSWFASVCKHRKKVSLY